MGFWKYGKELRVLAPPEKKEKPANALPEVDKFCSLFATLGERRLGSHLLGGFTILLQAIVDVAMKSGADADYCKTLDKIYPPGRVEHPSYSTIVGTGPPIIDGKTVPLREWCKQPVYTSEDYSMLITHDKIAAAAELLRPLRIASTQVQEWGGLLLATLPAGPAKVLLEKNLVALSAALATGPKSPLDVLFDIYARMGYEVGVVKRVMQDEGINWGSFMDHSLFEFHCNAHANNFAVLPRGYKCLLAPLDFDLSYEETYYVNTVKEQKVFGTHNIELFDNHTNFERKEMALGLAGCENMDFKYVEQAKTAPPLNTQLKNTLDYCLRDGMLEAYYRAFDKQPCPSVIADPDVSESLHILIKIALLLTHSIIA